MSSAAAVRFYCKSPIDRLFMVIENNPCSTLSADTLYRMIEGFVNVKDPVVHIRIEEMRCSTKMQEDRKFIALVFEEFAHRPEIQREYCENGLLLETPPPRC